MTNKIKLFLVFLAVLAVISVFSFFDVFTGTKSVLFSNSIKQFPVDVVSDVDMDGLSDAEESYWNTDFQDPDTDKDGYLDGEEAASRHDPAKPGPDDSLVATNITQSVAELTMP